MTVSSVTFGAQIIHFYQHTSVSTLYSPVGWAVYAAQNTLRLQYGPISHPQSLPSKYWLLNTSRYSTR